MLRNKALSLPKAKHDKKEEKLVKKSEITTPVAVRKSLPDDEYSPIQIRCTQDGGDDELDVVWDWNSPQSRMKKPYNRQRKRPPNNISPHVPRKLHPKHNLIPKFTSLKAELEKLSRQDNQSSNSDNVDSNETDIDDNILLNLSPELIDDIPQQDCTSRLENSDPFGDDSFDDDLITCTQQIEAAVSKPQPKKIEFLINNRSTTSIADDSFDAILTEFTDEDMVRLSQENEKTPVKNTPRKFYRTNSTPVHSPHLELREPKCSTPLRERFPRTKSANDCYSLANPRTPVKSCSPEEIEKKRLEAKARLEFKKFQSEIEKKRQEALEKLKKRRTQRNAN